MEHNFTARISMRIPGSKKPVGVEVGFSIKAPKNAMETMPGRFISAILNTVDEIVKTQVKIELKGPKDKDFKELGTLGS